MASIILTHRIPGLTAQRALRTQIITIHQSGMMAFSFQRISDTHAIQYRIVNSQLEILQTRTIKDICSMIAHWSFF